MGVNDPGNARCQRVMWRMFKSNSLNLGITGMTEHANAARAAVVAADPGLGNHKGLGWLTGKTFGLDLTEKWLACA